MKKIFYTTLMFLAFFSTLNAQFTKLYDFEGNSTSGREPLGALLYDGTWFYSTTSAGGSQDKGTIFKIKPDGTQHTLLHDFNGTDGERPATGLVMAGDYLFGTTSLTGDENGCVIYKIKSDGTGFSVVHDFGFSYATPVTISLETDGNFIYGVTSAGDGWGFLFKLNSDGSNYTVIKEFSEEALGRLPDGKLVPIGNELFGYTVLGGANGNGVIFKINPDGSGYTKLFDNIENGISALITDGTYLYGYSLYGGTSYPGLIFKLKTDGTYYSMIKELGEEGSEPSGYLTIHNNKLYGMAYNGPGNGSLFSLDTDGQNFEMLYECKSVFFTEDGERPIGQMIFTGNTFYGLMQLGGSNDKGTMYEYSVASGIDDRKVINDMHVFPNPAQSFITLKNIEGDFSVEIYNIAGQLVHKGDYDGESPVIINISNFESGSYIVRFTDRQNNIHETDFIKI